jgi:hypothetical protein
MVSAERPDVAGGAGRGPWTGVGKVKDLEQAIRERAHQLWTEGGCRDGHAVAHWLVAQREVLSASLGEIDRPTVNMPKPKKVKAASRKKQRAV